MPRAFILFLLSVSDVARRCGLTALSRVIDRRVLERRIDRLCDRRQLEAAALWLDVAVPRAEEQRNTRWMLKLVPEEILARESPDNLDATARQRLRAGKAWTPLRQLLMLDLFQRSKSRADALAALAEPEELRQVKAVDISQEAGLLDEMNLLDFIATTIALTTGALHNDAETGQTRQSSGPEALPPRHRPTKKKSILDDNLRHTIMLPIEQFANTSEPLPVPFEAIRLLADMATKHNDSFSRLLADILRLCLLNSAYDATDDVERKLLDELLALPANSPQQKGLLCLAQGDIEQARKLFGKSLFVDIAESAESGNGWLLTLPMESVAYQSYWYYLTGPGSGSGGGSANA